MPRLLAVCAVRQLRPDAGAVGVTAIDKGPVDGSVRIGAYASTPTFRPRTHGGEIAVVHRPAGAPTILDVYREP